MEKELVNELVNIELVTKEAHVKETLEMIIIINLINK